MNRQRKETILNNQVSKIVTYKLGGYDQKVLLDGKYGTNPILIFLHGGPGAPIPFSEGCRGMLPQFTDRCIMVYWDQLGCGINNHVIDDSFTIDRFVDMTVDLIKAVKNDFPNNPVNLFAVSWGSVLAAKAAARVPELLNRVMVYGQVLKNLTFNQEVYDELKRSGLSSKKQKLMDDMFKKDVHTMEELKQAAVWIRKYTEGYQSKSGGKVPLGTIIHGLLTSPDYSVRDFKAIIVNGYAKNKSLLSEMMKVDLSEELSNVRIPYLILQGSTDIVTSTKTISQFVAESQNKNLVFRRIENSGHMPSSNGIEKILTEGIPFISGSKPVDG
ncbi:MAG TPA: alpha/beta hydrolase [Ruminiclostridium sp.]|nr:alpha/beta hydrolase [Ruminiclostridium sp.]